MKFNDKGGNMKKIAYGFAVVLMAVLWFGTTNARAESVGYLEDTENFPNMLETKPTCSQAYDKFLSTAQPLNACRHLVDAKANLDAQQKVKDQMGSMKNCKSCTKMMVQADEAASAFSEQVKMYQAQCPDNKTQTVLLEKLPKQTKDVCNSCDNKWPGKIGPKTEGLCK